VIKSFVHKGLRKFYETGSTAGIQAKHKTKLKVILQTIDGADEVEDINLPGLNLHSLKGEMKGLWSVKVNGNWRVTFSFVDGHAYIVDYQDYH
jgi:proteic killer suppression protein